MIANTTRSTALAASFRDPSGFIFKHKGTLYRQVNQSYRDDYDRLMNSGLYQRLVDEGLLISHTEVGPELAQSDAAYKIIQPAVVPVISYPYEWSFSQLKAAALATLKIARMALDFGMSLKDSSAYNIQFIDGKPVLIDTLSFEQYQQDAVAWTPYRQFCQHFLAPLALMSFTDVRLNQFMRVYIDGVPVDLAARLLPLRSWLNLSLLLHIHLHARSQKQYQDKAINAKTSAKPMGRNALLGLLDNLESGVRGLNWKAGGTEWADYYQDDSYTNDSLRHKQALVTEFVGVAQPKSVWDLGANTGLFSRIASSQGIQTVAWDIDPSAVEFNFRKLTEKGEKNLLPLLLDLTNPSPGIGWNLEERMSLAERGPVDAIFALALIHHLAISNNVPLEMVARFFSGLCRWLVIEFVPKEDHKVQTLLATRKDIFPDYVQSGFEAAFGQHFEIIRTESINGSHRVLYLMRTKDHAV